jgi:hypothetical protein
MAPCPPPATNGLATEETGTCAATTPRDWRQSLTAVCSDRRTTSGVYCSAVTGLSHRQVDLSRFVHVAAGMTFSCLNSLCVTHHQAQHRMNETGLAAASLNTKGKSGRTHKAAVTLPDCQTWPQTYILLSLISALCFAVAASDLVSVAALF